MNLSQLLPIGVSFLLKEATAIDYSENPRARKPKGFSPAAAAKALPKSLSKKELALLGLAGIGLAAGAGLAGEKTAAVKLSELDLIRVDKNSSEAAEAIKHFRNQGFNEINADEYRKSLLGSLQKKKQKEQSRSHMGPAALGATVGGVAAGSLVLSSPSLTRATSLPVLAAGTLAGAGLGTWASAKERKNRIQRLNAAENRVKLLPLTSNLTYLRRETEKD